MQDTEAELDQDPSPDAPSAEGEELAPADQEQGAENPGAAEPDAAGSEAQAAPNEDGPAESEGADSPDGEDPALDDEPEAELPEGEALEAYVQSAFALLFASPEPLSEKRLRTLLVSDSGRRSAKLGKAGLELVVEALSERIGAAGLPVELRRIAGGLRLFTDPRLSEVGQRLDKTRRNEKISHAGLETLAIVAYRQPVTKAEIEAIRGVQAGPMLRQLSDRRLITVSGRADQPGAPLLYATTSEFLDRFGLADLDELPRDGELARD